MNPKAELWNQNIETEQSSLVLAISRQKGGINSTKAFSVESLVSLINIIHF
jgi:hypothetical protein